MYWVFTRLSSFKLKILLLSRSWLSRVSLASKQLGPYLTSSHLIVAISTESKLLQKWQIK